MGKSCKEIAESLVDCMNKTECVQKGGSVRECMNSDEENNEKPCSELRKAYFECKRSQLDNRTRIRGPKAY